MSANFRSLEPWERDAEERFDHYQRGLALVAEYGEMNLDDQFAVDALLHWLSNEDFQAYLFALEYRASLVASKQAKPALRSPDCVSNPPRHSLPAAGSEADVDHAISPPVLITPSDNFDESIDKAIERFTHSKRRSTTDATAEKYGAQCKLFLKTVAGGRTNLKVSELTPRHLRTYVDTLPRLPTRIDSKDSRTLEEILKTSGPTLSPKTVFAHAQATNMFLAWCESQQYPVRFNFHSILKPLLKKPRVKAKQKSFTPDQLKTLFGNEAYTAGTFKRPSDYWVPLLGLLTGAREAELCQLEASDVRKDAATGLWLLNINSDADKRLKTDSSAREVPLHPTLIDLGFLGFVNDVCTAKGSRLFDDEERNKRGEFSGFSKRFNRYKERLKIKSDAHHKLDFHSFRHTLQTMLFDAGEEEYVVNALCGHSPAQQSEGVRTYSRGPGLQAKYELLMKLKFAIDFTKIKPNGWTRTV